MNTKVETILLYVLWVGLLNMDYYEIMMVEIPCVISQDLKSYKNIAPSPNIYFFGVLKKQPNAITGYV